MPHRLTSKLGVLPILASLVPCVGIVNLAHADTLSVPSQYPTITVAVSLAQDGDVVEVAPGTYYEAVDFLGKEITIRSTGGRDVTTIDAFGTGSVITMTSSKSPVLDGFTITGGSATHGAGLYHKDTSGSPTILNCTFEDNTAPSIAGAIYIWSDVCRIENCIFRNNTSPITGGVYSRYGHTTISQCTFENNTAETEDGGAVRSYQQRLTIEDSTFIGNAALVGRGGAVSIEDTASSSNIERCWFEGNSAVNGGAVAAQTTGYGWLADCVLIDNSATTGGALYAFGDDSIYVYNSTLLRNEATSGSGHAAFASGSVIFYNSIIREHQGAPLSNRAYAYYSNIEGGTGTNIDADPLFHDADNNDFRLGFASPCIDAGYSYYVVSETDLVGHVRKFDDPAAEDVGTPYNEPEIVDMGAYESPLERIGDLFLDAPTPGIAGQINRHDVFNVTPDAPVYYAYAFNPGTTPLPVCGMSLNLDRARQSGVALAGADCAGNISLNVPSQASGLTLYFQAIEPSTCRKSNVVQYTFQ